MNRFVILACLAVTLIQHKADDDRAGKQGQQNTHASESKAIAPAPSQPAANSTDQKTAGNADKNKNQTVNIASVPKIAVKPEKDLTDWTIVICTLILTVVGIVGTCAAIKTLKAINRQAHYMLVHAKHFDKLAKAATDNAAAAKKSADALVASERAWVMAEIVWAADVPNAPRPTPSRIVEGSDSFILSLCLICKNDGNTPAWITRRAAWVNLFRVPPVVPDVSPSVAFTYSDLVPLSMGQQSVIQNEAQCDGRYPEVGGPGLVLYGLVTYRDAFGDHETWFGYSIHGDPKRPRIERLAGFPEYNKNS